MSTCDGRFLSCFLKARAFRVASCLAALLAGAAGGSVAAQVTAGLRVVEEFAPPGGVAIVQIELTEPQPISKGQMRVSMGAGPLLQAIRAVAFSVGNVQSSFNADTTSVTVQVTSADSSFGIAGDLPIVSFAVPVNPLAQPGQVQQITLDPGTIEFLDPQGQPYAAEVKPGSFTVGGFSIDQMSPASGLVRAGEKITFTGMALPADLKVGIDGATVATTQVVDSGTVEVTLSGDFTLQGTTRIRFDDPAGQRKKIVYAAILDATSDRPNAAPTPVDDAGETPRGQPLTLDLLSNDTDPNQNPLSLVSVSQPLHGTTQISSSSTVTYRPEASFQGTDFFSYVVADSLGATASAKVTVQVLPPLLQFERGELTIIRGTAERVVVNFNRQPPPDSRLLISASSAGVVQAPDSLPLSPGSGSLTLPIFGGAEGTTVLTATVGSETTTLTISVVQGSVLELPVLKNDQQEKMGLALTNRSQLPAEVRLRAYPIAPESSEASAQAILDLALDPLEPGSQRVGMLSEFSSALEGFRGWIELSSENKELSAMFLNLTGAVGGFAGASSSGRSDSLVFPQSGVSADGDFIFSLINNNPEEALIRLMWLNADGLFQEKRVVLAPQQALNQSVLQTFPDLTGGQARQGYLRVESSQPLSAYQQRHTARHLLGQRPPSLSDPTTRLFLPQAAVAPDWFTEVSLINPGLSAAEVTLRLVDGAEPAMSGLAARNPVSLTLEPGRQLIVRLKDLFGLAPAELRVGSLSIEATSPVVGSAVIGRETEGGPTAMVPLFSQTATEMTFAQAASGPFQNIHLFTGLAFQNPGDQPSTVTIRVLSPQGIVLAEGSFELGAGKRLSRLLSEILPELPAFLSGYLQISSSRPLLMLEIFGDTDLDFLSTVDGSRVPLPPPQQ